MAALVEFHSFAYGDAMTSTISRRPLTAEFISTLSLALPVMGSNLTQSLKHLTDAVMLGWYGVEELAAGVLGSTLLTLVFLVGSGCAMATVPLAASAEGSGETWRVRRVIRMGLWISLLFGLIVQAPLWHTEHFMLLLGQKPLTASLAADYMRIAMLSLFPALGIMALKSFFFALVRPQIVLWATLSGALLNIVANYALIFGNWGFPELGVKGAAIATIASHGLAFTVMVAWATTDSSFKRYSLFANFFRSDWPIAREVFRLGWPISATLIAETGFFAATAVMMGWIDTESLAAHGIVLEIAAFMFMIYLGLANAVTVTVGRALGARNRDQIVLASMAATILTVAVVVLAILVFVLLPETLIRAFLDSSTENAARVVEIGVTLALVAAMFQIGDALQVVGLGLLRGLKDTKLPMFIAALSYAMIGLPCSYVLGFTFGFAGPGVWFGFVIGLTTAAVLLYLRFWRMLSRLDFGKP